ncbi:hypothetical protein PFISCL1PPCAC_19160, partial [Pristionchus fissidentatus]
LISHIFSFVRHEDRISLRVNERLDEIELNGRYYNESIIVGLNSVQFIDYNGNSLELAIEGEEGKRAIEELKRVAKNTTYDEVECKDEEDVNPDVTARVEEMFSILCNIKAREFRLMANQIKDDSSLLATLKYKNEVTIKYIITGITAEGLLSLYQKIRNGEVDAKFVILCVSEEVWEGFLDLAKEEKFQNRLIKKRRRLQLYLLAQGKFPAPLDYERHLSRWSACDDFSIR